ncbi:hypothetical protein EBQ91_03115 [bacterium]|nr:hypothetical protein [bacterium]
MNMPMNQDNQDNYDKLVADMMASLEHHTSVGVRETFNNLWRTVRGRSKTELKIAEHYDNDAKRNKLIEMFKVDDEGVKAFCTARTLERYQTDMDRLRDLNKLVADAGTVTDEQKAKVKALTEYMETLYFISAFYKNNPDSNAEQKGQLVAYLEKRDHTKEEKALKLADILRLNTTGSSDSTPDLDTLLTESTDPNHPSWIQFFNHLKSVITELPQSQNTTANATVHHEFIAASPSPSTSLVTSLTGPQEYEQQAFNAAMTRYSLNPSAGSILCIPIDDNRTQVMLNHEAIRQLQQVFPTISLSLDAPPIQVVTLNNRVLNQILSSFERAPANLSLNIMTAERLAGSIVLKRVESFTGGTTVRTDFGPPSIESQQPRNAMPRSLLAQIEQSSDHQELLTPLTVELNTLLLKINESQDPKELLNDLLH